MPPLHACTTRLHLTRISAVSRLHLGCAQVELIDLYPTLLELAGVAGPRYSRDTAEQPRLAGRSLVPLMRRRPARLRLASALAISQ